MGHFKFNTLSTFDLALHHGHSALRLLKIAMGIEMDYLSEKDKLPNVPYGRTEYLKSLGKLNYLQTDMFRISCASIMMFQAMLEAAINDSVETEVMLSAIKSDSTFKDKWTNALTTLNQEHTCFDRYYKSIYRKFRNPIVHPKQIAADSFDDLCFAVLHRGYTDGWDALSRLQSGLGHPVDIDSWFAMCRAHQLPDAV